MDFRAARRLRSRDGSAFPPAARVLLRIGLRGAALPDGLDAGVRLPVRDVGAGGRRRVGGLHGRTCLRGGRRGAHGGAPRAPRARLRPARARNRPRRPRGPVPDPRCTAGLPRPRRRSRRTARDDGPDDGTHPPRGLVHRLAALHRIDGRNAPVIGPLCRVERRRDRTAHRNPLRRQHRGRHCRYPRRSLPAASGTRTARHGPCRHRGQSRRVCRRRAALAVERELGTRERSFARRRRQALPLDPAGDDALRRGFVSL